MANDETTRNGAAAGEGGRPGDDSIASLMRLAGPRPPIPRDVQARVHRSVKGEWRKALARRRAIRWSVPVALAASLVLAVALTGRLPLLPAGPVATIVTVDGSAAGSGFAPGDPVHRGDRISTGGSGMAVSFANGLSLRLAAGTTATVEASDELTLAAGKVYADTGTSVRGGPAITVHTRAGSATDYGTQFAVAYDDRTLTVAVREGRVDVAARRAAYTAAAGVQLILEPGKEARFDEIPPHDEAWDWAAALAPAFDIDDRPVLDFLKWTARETGRELVFANDGARLAAMAERLRGSVSDLTPAEALAAVRPTVPSFDIRVEERRIFVSLAQ